jgi:hypothetical protein
MEAILHGAHAGAGVKQARVLAAGGGVAGARLGERGGGWRAADAATERERGRTVRPPRAGGPSGGPCGSAAHGTGTARRAAHDDARSRCGGCGRARCKRAAAGRVCFAHGWLMSCCLVLSERNLDAHKPWREFQLVRITRARPQKSEIAGSLRFEKQRRFNSIFCWICLGWIENINDWIGNLHVLNVGTKSIIDVWSIRAFSALVHAETAAAVLSQLVVPNLYSTLNIMRDLLQTSIFLPPQIKAISSKKIWRPAQTDQIYKSES